MMNFNKHLKEDEIENFFSKGFEDLKKEIAEGKITIEEK